MIQLGGPSRQTPPRRFRDGARINAAVMEAAAAHAAAWVGDVIGKAVAEALQEMFATFHLDDLVISMQLYAHLEMGGQLKKPDDDRVEKQAKDFLSMISLSVFHPECEKFVAKLREENYSRIVPATILVEVEDQSMGGKKPVTFPIEKYQPLVLSRNPQWEESSPAATGGHTPAVLFFMSRKPRDPADPIPVLARCSIGYVALKDGRAEMKTLSFELYIEMMEQQKGDPRLLPWKIRNVRNH
jgi:hypothetical protein